MNKLFRFILLFSVLVISSNLLSQIKQVAITMDDIPFNALSKHYSLDEIGTINNLLLNNITENNTPVAAFFSGVECINTDSTKLRIQILKKWIQHPLITPGNHTLNHFKSSTINFDSFTQEVTTLDSLLKSLSNKPIKYFRFPYNDLGIDSSQQKKYENYLKTKNYEITPFTIESVDYLFNALYVHQLKLGNNQRADSIANAYIDFTIKSFQYFEKLSLELYNRDISHIFLIHANKLHSDYYNNLINALKEQSYKFISLENALKDPVYTNQNYYHKKWGISWVFRWIEDSKQRSLYLRNGIDLPTELIHEYENL